jgi:hypothetical protein
MFLCVLFRFIVIGLLGINFLAIKGQPVDLTVGTNKGAGLFCEFRKVVSSIIHYENDGFNSIFIDWRSPYFPYKDDFADQVNVWNLFLSLLS